MGGLGPGIGGLEIFVVGLVALLVVGPKDLPVLMRRVGRIMGKARAMANDFRASFDEMARQSELDDLRKEVEALRTGQGLHPLGPEAEAAFREIHDDLNRPADASAARPETTGVEEWPDVPVAEIAPEPPPEAAPEPVAAAPAPKTRSKPRTRKTASSADRADP